MMTLNNFILFHTKKERNPWVGECTFCETNEGSCGSVMVAGERKAVSLLQSGERKKNQCCCLRTSWVFTKIRFVILMILHFSCKCVCILFYWINITKLNKMCHKRKRLRRTWLRNHVTQADKKLRSIKNIKKQIDCSLA